MLAYRPQKTRKQLRPRCSAATIHISPRLYFQASSREESSQTSSSWMVYGALGWIRRPCSASASHCERFRPEADAGSAVGRGGGGLGRGGTAVKVGRGRTAVWVGRGGTAVGGGCGGTAVGGTDVGEAGGDVGKGVAGGGG